ncbi:MAG: DUF3134 domain-containing protein [Candidatus Parcubacteria bacterium]|uniref:DUF3134 domain-containing protein n=1 Tax=Phormidesmis priestleyi TaxID=268141 RepID=UPI00083B5B88|nr:DUF3134 domain-containing protein [Phormidesmis priestleyi]MBC7823729.1 DUF3134 domain-containing protein [Leptolyngbyaceae cyanobacterium LF-bin-113]MCY7275631.1 DUF3134 domain-containing protein [Phormidesmis sp. CAN_BIN44]
MVYNPSLREEPRDQRAAVIPVQQESSILDWLEKSGRLLAREVQEVEVGVTEDVDDINQFISEDDNSFDLDDDDDDLDAED